MSGLAPGDQITAERLRQLRARFGWSQYEVASKIGVSQSLLAAWENGRSAPSSVYLRSLALLYGVSVDEIVGNDAAERFRISWPEGWSILRRAGEELSPEKQQAVVRIVESLLKAEREESERRRREADQPS